MRRPVQKLPEAILIDLKVIFLQDNVYSKVKYTMIKYDNVLGLYLDERRGVQGNTSRSSQRLSPRELLRPNAGI